MDRNTEIASQGSSPDQASLDRVQAYFDRKSPYWRDVYEGSDVKSVIYRDRMALALQWIDELGLPAGELVLEQGCGAGLATVAMALRGFRVAATDIAAPMLELSQKLAKEEGVQDRITTCIADAHRLDFADNSFPLVTALGLLPWVQDPALAVREIARVLKPGGYVIATADNRWSLRHALEPDAPGIFGPLGPVFRKIHSWSQHPPKSGTRQKEAGTASAVASLHSIHEVDNWLKSAGLQKRKGATVGFGPITWFGKSVFGDSFSLKLHETVNRWARRNIAVARSAGSHYVVLARKPESLP